MTELPVLLIVVPLIGGGLALLEKLFPRIPLARVASFAAVLLCLVFLGLLAPEVAARKRISYALGGWGPPLGIELVLDGVAWLGTLMVMVVSLPILLFAHGERKYEPTFDFLFLLTVAGMVGSLLTEDLFNLFVCLEIVGIASFVLVAYFERGPALVAGFHYLVVSSLGMGFFLLGVYILYQHGGTLSLQRIAVWTADRPSSFPLSLAAAGIVAGIGVRAAFPPFHAWLPGAHALAPHPVSALLSGVMIKVAFFSLWRVLPAFEGTLPPGLFLWIGGISALAGVLLALAQTDAKRLLAFHSISQMGFILAAYGAGTALARAASLYHSLSHALFKSLLFLAIGAVIASTGERNLSRLGGLARRLLPVFITFGAGALAIAGLPPFNGYASKKLIEMSLEAHPAVLVLLKVAGVGTAASFIKLSGIFWKRDTLRGAVTAKLERLSPLLILALVFLALLCLATGLTPRLWIRMIATLTGDGLPAALPGFYSLRSVLEALGTAVLGWLLYLLVRSKTGQGWSKFVSRHKTGLDGSLLLLCAGLVVISLISRLWFAS